MISGIPGRNTSTVPRTNMPLPYLQRNSYLFDHTHYHTHLRGITRFLEVKLQNKTLSKSHGLFWYSGIVHIHWLTLEGGGGVTTHTLHNSHTSHSHPTHFSHSQFPHEEYRQDNTPTQRESFPQQTAEGPAGALR